MWVPREICLCRPFVAVVKECTESLLIVSSLEQIVFCDSPPHLEEWPTRPIALTDSLHIVWIQRYSAVGRNRLRDFDGIYGTYRVTNGATDTAFHIDLMLEIKVGNGVDRTKTTAAAAIDTRLLIDMIAELRLFHFVLPFRGLWPVGG